MPGDRLESPLIQIGDVLWCVLPDDTERYFACRVKYTGYTKEVTEYGKEYTHYVGDWWKPPVYGVRADDWPVPGKQPVPQRARLRLVASVDDLEDE